MATSAIFKNIVASNIFNTADKTAIPATLYLAVSKTAPNAAGGNVTEPVDGVTPCPRSCEPGTILRVKPQELTMMILDA
jgi:hypothetical protein